MAAFLTCGRLAIDLAARDEHNVPYVARGLACRMTPDRHRISVFAANRLIDEFIAALRATRAVAVVFCLASTHRAVQLKGRDAKIEPTLATDAGLVEKNVLGFAADLGAYGMGEAFVRAERSYRLEELIAISFTPDAVFEQTPGPTAGNKL